MGQGREGEGTSKGMPGGGDSSHALALEVQAADHPVETTMVSDIQFILITPVLEVKGLGSEVPENRPS